MSKKFKMPNISDKEIEELTRACQLAFGNDEADTFLDEALTEAGRLQKRRDARGEQSRTE